MKSYIVKNANGLKAKAVALSQHVSVGLTAPSAAQIQVALFAIGIGLLTLGVAGHGVAAGGISISAIGGSDVGIGTHDLNYNDSNVAAAVVAILTYLEGSFGALVMVTAGIAAILASAFGQYRAALGALVVAVGSFILRSFMSTFFNTQSIDDNAI